jgi:hypothetical protein
VRSFADGARRHEAAERRAKLRRPAGSPCRYRGCGCARRASIIPFGYAALADGGDGGEHPSLVFLHRGHVGPARSVAESRGPPPPFGASNRVVRIAALAARTAPSAQKPTGALVLAVPNLHDCDLSIESGAVMKFSVEIVGRGASLEQIREIYFSQEFDDEVAVAANLLERKRRDLRVEPDGTEKVRTRVVPHLSLPRAIEKLLNGRVVSYDEVVEYDPKAQRARFSIRSFAGKTVQVSGEIRFIEESTHVRLRFEGEARVHVFGLGGMLERYLVSEVTQRYGRAQDVLQSFIDRSA